MVMAAGSVMKEPSSGAMISTLNHHADGLRLPNFAAIDIRPSAKRSTGRLAAMAMMTPRKPVRRIGGHS